MERMLTTKPFDVQAMLALTPDLYEVLALCLLMPPTLGARRSYSLFLPRCGWQRMRPARDSRS